MNALSTALRVKHSGKVPNEVFEMIGTALHSSIIQDQEEVLETASRCSLMKCSCTDGHCEDRITGLKDTLTDHLSGGEKSQRVRLMYPILFEMC